MKLEAWFKKSKLSQTAFAEKVGVNPATVTRWLNGERRPSLRLAVKICAATNGKVQPNEWIVEETEPA